MATFFEYKCKGCGYTVNANPKGKDMVMMGINKNEGARIATHPPRHFVTTI